MNLWFRLAHVAAGMAIAFGAFAIREDRIMKRPEPSNFIKIEGCIEAPELSKCTKGMRLYPGQFHQCAGYMNDGNMGYFLFTMDPRTVERAQRLIK